MKNFNIYIILISLFISGGCTKFLEAVPDQSLAIPKTITDYRQLLENEIMFINAPATGEFGTDDIYMPDDMLSTQPGYLRNSYLWQQEIHEGVPSLSWNFAYNKIYYSNIVLEGISKLKNESFPSAELNELEGWALFSRANAHYDLQEIFGQPYVPIRASTDLGIPLKLGTNLNEVVKRATVEETFARIVTDLQLAIDLLPAEFPVLNRSKPSKTAAYALLARVYLIMNQYDKALECAKNSLALYSNLIDYNLVNSSARIPFSPLTNEVIFNSAEASYSQRLWQIDGDLYRSFADNDLRKSICFTVDPGTKAVLFKGFYGAALTGFNGLATDEVYLISAECKARLGLESAAILDLNTVLSKRFKTGTYVPYTISNVPNVLQLVLTERRKECIFRNLRWSDLRRLNQDESLAKTLTRSANGKTYQLLPESPRYAYPIPDEEVKLSGLIQNLR
jgi:tetratricopeptide (TPR) repeat protein